MTKREYASLNAVLKDIRKVTKRPLVVKVEKNLITVAYDDNGEYLDSSTDVEKLITRLFPLSVGLK